MYSLEINNQPIDVDFHLVAEHCFSTSYRWTWSRPFDHDKFCLSFQMVLISKQLYVWLSIVLKISSVSIISLSSFDDQQTKEKDSSVAELRLSIDFLFLSKIEHFYSHMFTWKRMIFLNFFLIVHYPSRHVVIRFAWWLRSSIVDIFHRYQSTDLALRTKLFSSDWNHRN